MLRKLRIRHAAKNAEKKSGLKQMNNHIFREKPSSVDSSFLPGMMSIHHPPTLTMTTTLSDEEEEVSDFDTSGVKPVENVDLTVAHVLVDIKEIDTTENEIAKLKLVTDELKKKYEKQLGKKDSIISQTVEELKRTRLDFLEVMVELSAKEEELSRTKQTLASTDVELIKAKSDLTETKEKLFTVSASLIQHQHVLHEKEQQVSPVSHIINVGKGIVGILWV